MNPAGSVTLSAVNATAAPIHNTADTRAVMSGTRSVAARSASVAGRSSRSQRSTGARSRVPHRIPSHSVSAR